uniref:Uncharacterized protein n=1 Tax=viral metagenome TaxID=1070528 RepID=A0A6H2A2N2_9ZZZZ
MPGVLLWGWDDTNKVWVKLQVDADGLVKVDMSAINLNDLGDVSVAAPADDDLFYYDDATGLWKSRKLEDADIPAGIARDAEVTADIATHAAVESAHHTKFTTTEHDVVARHPLANLDPLVCSEAEADGKVSTHAALTTGIHGVGALHAAGFHTAGQAVSKVIWKDAPAAVLDIDNQATSIDWTDLDLTAATSANAKFAILWMEFTVGALGASDWSTFYLRKNGTAATTPFWQMFHNWPDWFKITTVFIIGMDAGQVIEYKLVLPADANTAYITIHCLGYIE